MTLARPVALDLTQAHAYCEALARREARNFYPAFRLLPRDQRRGMCALYAFMRIADDLSDASGDVAGKRSALDAWRRQLDDALAGRYCHPLHPALHDTVTRFGVPIEYLQAVLDGVVMDLDVAGYDRFDDLYRYCYRVASAVGLACIHVWGFTDARAAQHAEAAGIAFQLTNILRDLGEDCQRGRIYLPREDLERFKYSGDALRQGQCDDGFRALMRFEVERARSFYHSGAQLGGLLRPAGRAVFQVMSQTYASLLDAIERRDYDVFSRRIRLSRTKKLWLAARALPVRWGWA